MIVRTGHRVPGVISWPAVVRGNRESWSTAITSDFLPTMMEVLGVERPESQRRWAIDGISQLALLRGEELAPRCIGHIFDDGSNRAYRCGKWKLVNGTLTCKAPDCSGPMLCASSARLTPDRVHLRSSYLTNLTPLLDFQMIWTPTWGSGTTLRSRSRRCWRQCSRI